MFMARDNLWQITRDGEIAVNSRYVAVNSSYVAVNSINCHLLLTVQIVICCYHPCKQLNNYLQLSQQL